MSSGSIKRVSIGKMGPRVMSVGIAASFQKMVHGMICAQIRAFRPDNVPIVPWRRKLASGKPSQKIKKPGFNPGLTRSELDHLQEVVAGLEGRWRQQIKGGFHQNPACLPALTLKIGRAFFSSAAFLGDKILPGPG